jgi:hypothetical protein
VEEKNETTNKMQSCPMRFTVFTNLICAWRAEMKQALSSALEREFATDALEAGNQTNLAGAMQISDLNTKKRNSESPESSEQCVSFPSHVHNCESDMFLSENYFESFEKQNAIKKNFLFQPAEAHQEILEKPKRRTETQQNGFTSSITSSSMKKNFPPRFACKKKSENGF